VIEAYGNAYRTDEDPMFERIIEYFDGRNYLFFVFDFDGNVWSWGISTMTMFQFWS